jgi:outer membrane protein assembly factor BamB
MNSNNWVTPMKNYRRTGNSKDKLQLPLQLKWKKKVGGYVWQSSPIKNDVFIIMGPKGIGAFRVFDGELIWQNQDFQKTGMASACIAENIVLATGKDGLIAFSMIDGKRLWAIESNCDPWGTPCVLNRMVFWGTLIEPIGRELWAADIDRGQVFWKYPGLPQGSIIPSASPNGVYISCVNSVLKVDPNTGKKCWIWTDEIPGIGGLGWSTVTDDFVITSVTGLVCLGTDDGKILWRSRGKSAVSLSHDMQIAYVASINLQAINVSDGQCIWSTEGYNFHGSAPIVVGDYLVIGGGFNRFIYIFDRKKGDQVWEFGVGDLANGIASYSNGHILIGSHDGYLYCFSNEGS